MIEIIFQKRDVESIYRGKDKDEIYVLPLYTEGFKKRILVNCYKYYQIKYETSVIVGHLNVEVTNLTIAKIYNSWYIRLFYKIIHLKVRKNK